jgi:GT2 family glycosyltransferase
MLGLPHVLQRVVEVLQEEGRDGVAWRVRRRLLGGQAQVFADYARWLEAEPRSSPPAERPGAELLVSVVTPVCDPPPAALRALLESLRAQEHARWELCLGDDASRSAEVRRLLDQACADGRVRLARQATRRGIAATTNLALSLARGDLVAFVDHDDLLAPDALRRAADALAAPGADVAFTDEDKVDGHCDGARRFNPFFKPAFDPVLLLRCNYLSHLLVARHDLVRRVGGLRLGFDGSQDYDLVLRLTEVAERVVHLPHVLYHWRSVAGSTARSPAAKAWAYEAARRALEDALRRRGLPGRVAPGAWLGSHRVTLDPRVAPGEVSVIVDAAVAPPWLRGLPVAEVLTGAGGVTARRAALVARARGRFVLLLGQVRPAGDARAALDALLAEADRPGVGFVAGKVSRASGLVEHGLFLGHGPDAALGPLEPDAHERDLGYFGLLSLPRTVAAASGLALLVDRVALEATGGLDAVGFPDAGPAGADLCLRGARAGLRTVVVPDALFRLGPQDHARHDLALGAARGALRARVACAPDDPFSHPAFARGAARLRLADDAPRDPAPRVVDARTGAWWPAPATAPRTADRSRSAGAARR